MTVENIQSKSIVYNRVTSLGLQNKDYFTDSQTDFPKVQFGCACTTTDATRFKAFGNTYEEQLCQILLYQTL
jgi:hypothetical protein